MQKELQEKLTEEEAELRKNYEKVKWKFGLNLFMFTQKTFVWFKKCEEQKKLAEKNRQLQENLQIYVNLIREVLPKSEFSLVEKLLNEKPPTTQISEQTVKKVEMTKKSSGSKPSIVKRGRPSLKQKISQSQSQSPPMKPDSPKKKRGRSSLGNTTVINKLSISSL